MGWKVFKIGWLVVVGLYTLCAFLGWVPAPPKDVEEAKKAVASIDDAIFGYAAYPSLFALGVGLLLGTAVIPEIWRSVRCRFFPPPIRPDMGGVEMFRYIREDSKWSLNRPREVGGKILDDDLAIEVRNAAAQGRIKVWGIKEDSYQFWLVPAQIELPAEVWTKTAFDVVSTTGAREHVFASDFNEFEKYDCLLVSGAQVYQEWPKASLFHLWTDPHRKSRRYG